MAKRINYEHCAHTKVTITKKSRIKYCYFCQKAQNLFCMRKGDFFATQPALLVSFVFLILQYICSRNAKKLGIAMQKFSCELFTKKNLRWIISPGNELLLLLTNINNMLLQIVFYFFLRNSIAGFNRKLCFATWSLVL